MGGSRTGGGHVDQGQYSVNDAPFKIVDNDTPEPPNRGQGELLTPDELKVGDLLAEAYNLACKVIAKGPTAPYDAQEFAHHIHILQNMILAQAAARAYPHRYRLMGETLQKAIK